MLDEEPVHRRRIILERVDPAGDESERRLGNFFRHQAHVLPGIFPKLAHGFLEMRPGNQLDAFEPGVVQLLGDRQHHARRHVLGPQTLDGRRAAWCRRNEWFTCRLRELTARIIWGQ